MVQTKVLKLNEIKPYKNNPRINEGAVDSVAKSIQQVGYITLIVVDENYEILAGHTRLKALQSLGYQECEVIVRDDLTESQKRKYRLLDNKTGELAYWDIDLLIEELDGLDFEDLYLDWGVDDIETEDEDDEEVKLVNKKLLKCPSCGFINEEKAFKTYEDTD